MKHLLIALALVSFVLSCSNETEVEHIKTVKGAGKKNKITVNANTMVQLQIEGMSCEKGCGGTIRKALKGTGAVKSVRYDFQEGRAFQYANVELDSNKIVLDSIKGIITSLNENQFNIKSMQLKAL